MMDYEVLKLKDEKWAMQVNGRLYFVPRKWRNLNKIKLMHVFGKFGDEFPPVDRPKQTRLGV